MRVVSTNWRYPASQGRTRGQGACFQKGEGDVNRSGLRGYEGKRMGQQIACELHANASTESLWSCLRPRSLRSHRRRATLFWSRLYVLVLTPDLRHFSTGTTRTRRSLHWQPDLLTGTSTRHYDPSHGRYDRLRDTSITSARR